MSEKQFDNKVRGTAQQLASERDGRKYHAWGAVNSNAYVHDVITESGGKVPYQAIRKQQTGIAPGICGGWVTEGVAGCSH